MEKCKEIVKGKRMTDMSIYPLCLIHGDRGLKFHTSLREDHEIFQLSVNGDGFFKLPYCYIEEGRDNEMIRLLRSRVDVNNIKEIFPPIMVWNTNVCDRVFKQALKGQIR